MTADFDVWKEVAKDAVLSLGGGIVHAIFKRRRRPPISIAPEPERFTCTREEWDDLMSKVAEMSTQIALHEEKFDRVKEDRAEFKAVFETVAETLHSLDKGMQAIQLQLARMGAPPA